MKPMRRIGFVGYALLLFVATHWPALTVPGPIPRTDLFVHLGAFGTWTLLLSLAGFFGPPLSTRNLGLCWLFGLANCLIDEGLQSIPWVQRHCAWDDATANMTGATAAMLLLLTIAIVRQRRLIRDS